MPTTVLPCRMAAAALVVGAVTAAACACSFSATPSAATGSTSQTTAVGVSPSPSGPSPASEAVAAYAAMWKQVAEASTTDDYQASYLSAHLSGNALLSITNNLVEDKTHGVVGRGAPILHPVVTSATASTVAISDCVDDRAWLQYSASTGRLLNGVPGGFRATTATVTDQLGIWKVTQINTGADGTCYLSSPTG